MQALHDVVRTGFVRNIGTFRAPRSNEPLKCARNAPHG